MVQETSFLSIGNLFFCCLKRITTKPSGKEREYQKESSLGLILFEWKQQNSCWKENTDVSRFLWAMSCSQPARIS